MIEDYSNNRNLKGEVKVSEELKGVWRTIAGRRIFIANGQSLTEAMTKSGKFREGNSRQKLKNQLVKKKNEHKQKQLEIIKKTNSMTDDYHTRNS